MPLASCNLLSHTFLEQFLASTLCVSELIPTTSNLLHVGWSMEPKCRNRAAKDSLILPLRVFSTGGRLFQRRSVWAKDDSGICWSDPFRNRICYEVTSVTDRSCQICDSWSSDLGSELRKQHSQWVRIAIFYLPKARRRIMHPLNVTQTLSKHFPCVNVGKKTLVRCKDGSLRRSSFRITLVGKSHSFVL